MAHVQEEKQTNVRHFQFLILIDGFVRRAKFIEVISTFD